MLTQPAVAPELAGRVRGSHEEHKERFQSHLPFVPPREHRLAHEFLLGRVRE